MVGAVDQLDPDVDHRVAGLDAVLQRLLHPLLGRADELGGDHPALDLVDEVEALFGRRLEVDHHVAELAATAGLAHEAALDLLDPLADRLAVGDLRAADVGVDLELAQHPVDDHLEVQLAHAVDQGLAGLLVGLDLEGRVLLGEAGERGAQLLLVGLRLRLDRDRDHRLGELDRLQLDRRVRGRQGVAGPGLLEADAGADVARVALLDLLAMVGVHHQQPSDPLRLAGRDVEHPSAGAELAGVDAEVGQLADVGVGHHLEGEGGEGSVVVGGPGGLGALLLALRRRLDPGQRRDLERRGQQLDDRVEQRLHALVLERGAAEDRGHLDVQGGAVQRPGDPLVGDLLLVEVGLHQLVVVVRAGLDQLRAVVVGLLGQLGGDL